MEEFILQFHNLWYKPDNRNHIWYDEQSIDKIVKLIYHSQFHTEGYDDHGRNGDKSPCNARLWRFKQELRLSLIVENHYGNRRDDKEQYADCHKIVSCRAKYCMERRLSQSAGIYTRLLPYASRQYRKRRRCAD